MGIGLSRMNKGDVVYWVHNLGEQRSGNPVTNVRHLS